MLSASATIPVAICETQPATSEGLKIFLSSSSDLECLWAVSGLPLALQLVRQRRVRVMVLDRAFGLQEIAVFLDEMRQCAPDTGVVVWGGAISESEALRFLHAGARGLLLKSAPLPQVLACFRAVADGLTWLEEALFGPGQTERQGRQSSLTQREQQVLKLVERGLKNREIALELGISPGTVKIHLKHIFEKTGVHGRYGLALNGLRLGSRMSESSPIQTLPMEEMPRTA